MVALEANQQPARCIVLMVGGVAKSFEGQKPLPPFFYRVSRPDVAEHVLN